MDVAMPAILKDTIWKWFGATIWRGFKQTAHTGRWVGWIKRNTLLRLAETDLRMKRFHSQLSRRLSRTNHGHQLQPKQDQIESIKSFNGCSNAYVIKRHHLELHRNWMVRMLAQGNGTYRDGWIERNALLRLAEPNLRMERFHAIFPN